MTDKEFNKWVKNGNFTISQERILSITNDIAENIHDTYTKKEAAQCVSYWSLEFFSKCQTENNRMMGRILKQLTRLQRRQRGRKASKRK